MDLETAFFFLVTKQQDRKGLKNGDSESKGDTGTHSHTWFVHSTEVKFLCPRSQAQT